MRNFQDLRAAWSMAITHCQYFTAYPIVWNKRQAAESVQPFGVISSTILHPEVVCQEHRRQPAG